MNFTSPRIKALPRVLVVALTFVILVAVGLADFLTGYEISFSVFYLVAISMALWLVGRGFAILISALSIASWILGDLAAGAQYSNSFVLVWNAVITLTSYIIVVGLLSWLKSSQETLEKRVSEKTAALRDEMTERERLEKEILAISEREQRRIGYDLHDNLCQHLTGTAIAAVIVEQDLAEMGIEKASGDVRRLVNLVEEGISLSREIARGLSPVQLEPQGLMDAFEALAATTSNRLKTECHFEHDGPVLVDDAATAIHLYRIAQEAISNAIRHGRAKRFIISFSEMEDVIVLAIKDDGCGLPSVLPVGKGMGLRIMKHRATMIGAGISVNLDPGGGTIVSCSLKNKISPSFSSQDV